jgi:hypothetical protein
MKRIQEKVKDIVEVRAYESLLDYTANPAQTLAFIISPKRLRN